MIAAALLLLAPQPARAQPAVPAVGAVAAQEAGFNGAVVSWTTDQPADTAVDYGPTAAYGSTGALSAPPSTRHVLTLGGLAAGTLYHYRVRSRNALGAEGVSGDFTFSTPAPALPPAVPAAPPPAAAPRSPESGPLVVIMNPPSGAVASGSLSVSANATAGAGMASVQFLVDGREAAPPLTAAPYAFTWATALASDGPHSLAAVARDAAGRVATSPIVAVTVDNAPPVITGVAVDAVSAGSAILVWKTNERADSQADYGTVPSYGLSTPLNASMVVTRGVPLAGLAAGTLYYYQVKSRDAAGLLTVAGPFTFTTAAAGAGASVPAPQSAAGDAVRAAQKVLTPASADGINDRAVFGPDALEVSIVDLRGRQVFHAVSSGSPIVWDCRDGSGSVAPSGVYIARIVARGSKRLYQSFAIAK